MSLPNGSTRLYPIIGDPIAQVKSPGGVTAALRAHGVNAHCVPLHIGIEAVDTCIEGLSLVRNVDGILATVPHKFAAFRHAASATPRATRLGTANVLRRNGDSSWHADMLDGLAFVTALRRAGCEPLGLRALLIGAGGAGTAIAFELIEAGVAVLAIHDADRTRRDQLVARLAGHRGAELLPGSPDPSGFDIIVNATPAGMRPIDPVPVQIAHLSSAMILGDVITVPEVTPLLAAARAVGCRTTTGIDMFHAGLGLIIDFLLNR